MDVEPALAGGVPLGGKLRAFRDAGKPRCCVYRRRSKAPMEAAARRSPFDPPALLELALFGLRVQPPRELTARKSKENQGKRLGFPWIPLAELGLFNGLQRIQTKKSAARSTRLRGCAQTPVLDAFPPSLAPSDPSIVNWSSAERHSLCFWICQRIGLRPRGRRSDQNEPRGSRRQISSRPWRR